MMKLTLGNGATIRRNIGKARAGDNVESACLAKRRGDHATEAQRRRDEPQIRGKKPRALRLCASVANLLLSFERKAGPTFQELQYAPSLYENESLHCFGSRRPARWSHDRL